MGNQTSVSPLRDDPSRDFRQRYHLPDQFVWDMAAWPRIDFDSYMALVLDLLPKPPARVLDVGCGPGLGSKIMAERGYDVTGIDYNQRAIEFAKLLVPDTTFLAGDVRCLAEMAQLHGQFDVATCIEVIEHIPPDYHPRVLQGIHEILGPGGMLILAVPSSRMPLNRWHYQHFRLDELTGLVDESGFQVRRVIYQHRISLLFSRAIWRLLNNKYYDIRAARHMLRWAFLRWFSTTNEPDRAGRFIIQAEKPR